MGIQVLKGICQSCRGRLCDDRPFDCSQAPVSGNWACQSCHENGSESTCHFPAKPTKAEKAAWNSFQLIYGKHSRSSNGGHLTPSGEASNQAAVTEPEQRKAAESLAPLELWVTLKCDQLKASLHAAQVASTAATDKSSNNGDWSTAVNRPPTPPDSVGDFMEISNKSRKNSTIESPLIGNLQSTPFPSKKAPESDLDLNSDSADNLASPRKRRRLQRGLRDRQDFSPAREDQPPTLKPSRSGSLPNHNDEELLKKFTETARRRASANGKLLSPTTEVFVNPSRAALKKLNSSSDDDPIPRKPTREAETAKTQQPAPEEDPDLVMLDTHSSKQISNVEIVPASELQGAPSKVEQPITETSIDDSYSPAAEHTEVSHEAASRLSDEETTLDVDMNYNFSGEPSASATQSRSNQLSQVELQANVAQTQHPASDEDADDVEKADSPNREPLIDAGGKTPDSGDTLGPPLDTFTNDQASRPEEGSGFRIRQEVSSSSADIQHSIRQIGESASEAQMHGWHVSISPFGLERTPPLTNTTSSTNMLLAQALNPPPQNTQPDTYSVSRASGQESTAQLPSQDLPPNPAAEEANSPRPVSSGGKLIPMNTYIEDMLRGSRKDSFAPAPVGQSPTSPISGFATQESETRPTSGWTPINASPQIRKSDAVPDMSHTPLKRNSGASAPSKKRSFKGPDLSELKTLAPAPTSPSNSSSPGNANSLRNKRHHSASKHRASSQTSLPQQTPAVQQPSAAVQGFSLQQPAALPHASTPQTLTPQDVQVAAPANQTRHNQAHLLTEPPGPGSSAHSEELGPRSRSVTDITQCNPASMYGRNNRLDQEESRVHDPSAIGQQRLEGSTQTLGPSRSPQTTSRVPSNASTGPAVRYPWVQNSRAGSPLRHSLSAHAHGTSAHATMQPNQQGYRQPDAHSHSANVSPTTNLPQLEHDTIFQRYPMEVPPPSVRLNRPFTGQDLRRGSAPAHSSAAAPEFPQPAHQATEQGNVSTQGPLGHTAPAHKSNMPSAYPFLQHQRKISSQGQPPAMPSQLYSRHPAEEEAMRRACGPSNTPEDSLFYRNPFETLAQQARKRSQPDTAAATNPADEAQPKPAKKPRKAAARKSQARQEEQQGPSPATQGGSEPIQRAPPSQPSFSIDQTKIRLYVRPSPAYEAMRLGPAKTCGEFVETILKRVDVSLQMMHILKVSFSWMPEGQNGRSLWMRGRDDADAFGEIVDELQGRLRQAPQESPRLDVELYLK